MEHILSERVKNLPVPGNLLMSQKAKALQKQGIEVLDLTLGEPDFKTPKPIQDAAKEAIDSEAYFSYPPISGYDDLREVIAKKLNKENNIICNAEQITVTNGSKQAIMNVFLSTLNPGDEVVVYTPYWPAYETMIKLVGAEPVFIEGPASDEFKASPAQLAQAITPRTKLVLYCNPCNPSGAIFSKQELLDMAEVLAEHPSILVLADEIYEYINFTDTPIVSMGALESMKDRTVTTNGVSKGEAMTGWRLGYSVGPIWLAKACDKVQMRITGGACGIAQRAAMVAIATGKELSKEMVVAYKQRRDLLLEQFRDIPGVDCVVPEGAFYVFPDISSYFGKAAGQKTIHNAHDLCEYLLDTVRVALVPGEAFGDPHCVRMCFAASETVLKEAMKRIKEGMEKLQ